MVTKSYVKSSRFVQPKRSSDSQRENEATNSLNMGQSTAGSTKGSSSSDEGASPTSVTAASRPSDDNIEDILSNLEQVYDPSISKWDQLRKTEEREHALMRGQDIVTTFGTSSSRQQHQSEDSKLEEIDDATDIDTIKVNDAAEDDEKIRGDTVQHFVTALMSPISVTVLNPTKVSVLLVPNETWLFLVWFLLWISALRLSALSLKHEE